MGGRTRRALIIIRSSPASPVPAIPHSLQRFWFGLHPLLRILLIILAIVLPALLAWRPASKIYYVWRTKDDLKEAAASLSQRNYPEVRRLSTRVLSQQPRSPEAIRMLLEAEVELDTPRRTQIALMYLALDNGDAAGRLMAWRTLSSSACTWLAASAWRTLKPHESSDIRFCGPWIERMRREGLSKEALKLLDSMPEPPSPEIARLEFKTLAMQGETTTAVTLQLRLENLLKEKDDRALPLLEATDLLPFDALMPDLAKTATKTLASQEDPTLEQTLRLARFRMVANPANRDAIFTEAFDHAAKENPITAASWAERCGRSDVAKSILMQAADGKSTDPYRLLAEVLLKNEAWEDWTVVLSRYPADESPAWMDCDRIFVSEKKSDTSVRSSTMARIDALSAHNGALIEPARRATKLGMTELSRKLWIRAISEGEGPLPLSNEFSSLFRTLAEEKDEDNLLAVLTSYRFLEPVNTGIVTRQLYLACLKGRATPENLISAITEKGDSIHASNHQIATVLAFAHLLNHEPQKAAAVTDSLRIPWQSTPPSQRAIRAITLRQTGRAGEADALLKDFPWDNLLPSERRVFESMIHMPN